MPDSPSCGELFYCIDWKQDIFGQCSSTHLALFIEALLYASFFGKQAVGSLYSGFILSESLRCIICIIGS